MNLVEIHVKSFSQRLFYAVLNYLNIMVIIKIDDIIID